MIPIETGASSAEKTLELLQSIILVNKEILPLKTCDQAVERVGDGNPAPGQGSRSRECVRSPSRTWPACLPRERG